jgi:hypothetical protein
MDCSTRHDANVSPPSVAVSRASTVRPLPNASVAAPVRYASCVESITATTAPVDAALASSPEPVELIDRDNPS